MHERRSNRRRQPKYAQQQQQQQKQQHQQQRFIDDRFELIESPYYTIDNTEDIYGTTLSRNQRSYLDPWDLENYDYVRKKLDSSSPSLPSSYYDVSLSPDRIHNSPQYGHYAHCELECCVSPVIFKGDRIYGNYESNRELDDEDINLYTSYAGAFSSPVYNMSDSDTRFLPNGIPDPYESYNPYTIPCASECYECLSQIYSAGGASSSLYGYGFTNRKTSTLRRPSSSLYDDIYLNKFGLSKKGLLQIDYSCSWNDLDRVIGGNATQWKNNN